MSAASNERSHDAQPGAIEVPDALTARYAEWSWTLVSCTGEAKTWHIEDPTGSAQFVKVTSTSTHPTVSDAAARLQWAHTYLPVPEVLAVGSDGRNDWLVTTAMAGCDLTVQGPNVESRRLVEHFARALRQLHDRAPVATCPFEFTLDIALAHVRARVDAGLVCPEDFQPEHSHLSAADALAQLERLRPDREDLVVCHGDYCPPNVLLADDTLSGYVDLAELGVSDRWRDLAMGTWSTTWNFGPGHEDLFLDIYGAEHDQQRCAFYRLLHEMVS
jgi:kanamycin kinase